MLRMIVDQPKTPTPPSPVDVLSEVLDAAALGLAFASVTTLHGSVGVAVPGDLDVALHVVLDGRVIVAVDGQPPLALVAGHLLVLPVDRPHSVSDAVGSRLLSVAELPPIATGVGANFQLGVGPTRTTVLTAAFQMQAQWTTGLLRVLPEAIVHTREQAARAWTLAMQLVDEIRGAHPGRSFLVRRYGEALLVEALRPELTDTHSANLLRGIGDRGLRLALEAIHRDCARDWTVEELARIAGSSRSALAERFRTQLGVSPRQYLIDWRMSRAAKLLGSTDLSVAEVALATGYASEPAFARTFKRATGITPGRYRRDRNRQPAGHPGIASHPTPVTP
jgi:AraC-like DNA-binding protein